MNYHLIYNQLIERARNRVPDGYVERHHVLPHCMGGSDDNSNVVALYPEEHFLAHVLLVKMYPDHPGLISAIARMSHGKKGKRVRRKLYGWLKRRHAEYMRQLNTGSNNKQFGTRWIHRGIENKKINRDDPIPEGWEIGRQLKEHKYCKICGQPCHKHSELYCVEHADPFGKRKQLLQQTLNNALVGVATTNRGYRKKLPDSVLEEALVKHNFDIPLAMCSLGYKRGGSSVERFQKIAARLQQI